MMLTIRHRYLLFYIYFLFALAFSSGTILIMQAYEYGIAMDSAQVLFLLKDIALVFAAFVLAVFVPHIGYRYTIAGAIVILSTASAAMPFSFEFIVPQVLFACIGFSFGLVKVAIYALFAGSARSESDLGQYINRLEAVFLLGMLVSLMLFGYFAINSVLDIRHAFLVITALGIIALVLMLFIKIPAAEQIETAGQARSRNPFRGIIVSLNSLTYTLIVMSLLCLFLIVMAENQFSNWVMGIGRNIQKMSENVEQGFVAALILAAAGGRLLVSYLAREFSLNQLLAVLIMTFLGMSILVSLIMLRLGDTAEITSWSNLPDYMLLLLIMTAIGSAILPTFIAKVLWHTPATHYSSITGVIISVSVISALLGKYASNFLTVGFTYDIQIAFITIPVTLLFVVAMLFIVDLRKSTN
jgi:MFS family permease